MKADQLPLSDFSADEDAKDSRVCQSIEWYAEGQTRLVDVDGVQVAIRFVGRHGRRGRIAIIAPPGAVFRAGEMDGQK